VPQAADFYTAAGRPEVIMLPKMYSSLAEWWPLVSAPEEYEEEAAAYCRYLLEAGDPPARTLLELGSGGGNNASYLKQTFTMTLVDLSPGMLAHSVKLNPECEHHIGDMRSVRLGREFDRVFVHDAVCYMTSREDLRRMAETAYCHCRPGGGLVVVPDCVRETFQPDTSHGGRDGGGRGVRYLEWCWDPDPADSTYVADYVYLLRDSDGSVRTEHDRHVSGLFSRAEWLEILREVGFLPRDVLFEHSEVDYPLDVFVCTRPRLDHQV
jgi:SAM-dependent methyltransferase